MSAITSIGFSSQADCYNKTKGAGNNAAEAIFDASAEKSAASSTQTVSLTETKKKQHDYAAEFLDYMKKTPAQRLHDDILKQLGLTEDEVDKLPPAERQKVEDKIADIIKKKLTGEQENASATAAQQFDVAGNSGILSDSLSSSLLQLQEVEPQV
jgi:hypothetical protein